MSIFISNWHSIKSAASNLRRRCLFHGDRKTYEKLKLSCPFTSSSRNQLEVQEYFTPCSFEDICKNKRIILLDGIFDPGNVGSIIRSAAICKFSVLLRKGCPINETVLRCASGGVDCTDIFPLKNTSEYIRKLKERGYFFVALDEEGKEGIESISCERLVCVIGAEDGLSSLLKNSCDILATLRTPGKMSTFNASVAAALAMYHLSI